MKERGFSLIEVLIGMLILSIALLGLLTLFAQAVIVADFGEDDLIAKQKAKETLESIYTARNTKQISFSMLRGTSDGGVFTEGFHPLYLPGSDGLTGTADDSEPESITTPGADGLMGTADDAVRMLSDYERQIAFEDINEDLRKVTVIVRYRTAHGIQRTYELASYVSRFR